MARRARYFLADQPLHVIQRGNNRGPIFFADDDYACYCAWLAAAAGRYGCAVHAYVLMTKRRSTARRIFWRAAAISS